MTLRLPTMIMLKDVIDYINYHGEVTELGVRLETPCKKLENGKCSIYSHRPMICQTYPVGGSGCISAIKRMRKGRVRNKLLALLENK